MLKIIRKIKSLFSNLKFPGTFPGVVLVVFGGLILFNVSLVTLLAAGLVTTGLGLMFTK